MQEQASTNLYRCVIVIRLLYIVPDASCDGSHAKASCNPDDVLPLVALNVRHDFSQRVATRRHFAHVVRQKSLSDVLYVSNPLDQIACNGAKLRRIFVRVGALLHL